ncbi:MAG: CpsD/CapB family tyrosine-protein kinase [Balneolia bacterium]|nr:CpsD/CapB family tyrosine-protein kinase [Balneolia bacterium]
MNSQEVKQESSSSIILKDHKSPRKNGGLLPVLVSAEVLQKPDKEIIQWKHYNSFNFSRLAKAFGDNKLTVGITSARPADGKTVVAANMAVSLASGYQQKTLIIDMNFQRPSLHNVFGAESSPGLAEALCYEKIRVVPTSFENLYLMPIGDVHRLKPGIEHTLILRQILNTVKHEFDFVIVDMCSILPIEDFPVHFINEIDGLISVVNANKTKKGELEKVFKHIEEKQFLGYVFNKVEK